MSVSTKLICCLENPVFNVRVLANSHVFHLCARHLALISVLLSLDFWMLHALLLSVFVSTAYFRTEPTTDFRIAPTASFRAVFTTFLLPAQKVVRVGDVIHKRSIEAAVPWQVWRGEVPPYILCPCVARIVVVRGVQGVCAKCVLCTNMVCILYV